MCYIVWYEVKVRISLGKEKCFKRMFPPTQKKFRICKRGEGTSAEKTQIPKNSNSLRRGALVELPGFNLDYTQDIPRYKKKA